MTPPHDAPVDNTDDDYGTDIELDDELEGILVQAETSTDTPIEVDIEDIVRASPYEEFRRKGWLSVSDLVGTVWCEVQYDYRLRTLPYLPPEKRPAVITSKQGASITVDRVKVEDKERILRRGEKIHKRLEREIHPDEIRVQAITREDVWGLRFLNMFSALEALLTLGKCRELPVVGFVNGVMIMGVIDEITRKAIDETSKPSTRAQTTLTSFFSPTKPRPQKRERTHKLFVSDSKTRASGTVPQESDTLAGRLQVMLYKELLDALLLPSRESPVPASPDAILPTETPFQWDRIFQYLNLDPQAEFSETFLAQSRPIIIGNNLKYGVENGKTLEGMVESWYRYVEALGLGTPSTAEKEKNTGRTEDRLELVYRRAGAKSRKGKDKDKLDPRRKGKRKKDQNSRAPNDEAMDEDLQRAIAASLKDTQTTPDVVAGPSMAVPDAEIPAVDNDEQDAEDDELAWAVEMSLGATVDSLAKEDQGEMVIRTSQQTPQSPATSALSSSSTPDTPTPPRPPATLTTTENTSASGSGTIIGRTVFTHSPRRLAAHLVSVLDWWMGKRDAIGVSIEETRRCGWCEFEEGCEWRSRKAQEAIDKARAARNTA